MKKYAIIYCLILFLALAITPGCIDYFYSDDGSTTYVSHPTEISYKIRYGYSISCTGFGEYNIRYDCDIPDTISGNVIFYETIGQNYDDKTVATFLMKTTEFPDVYEIFMFSKSKKAKVGYAGIPNIKTSVMVKDWFEEKGEDELYAKFEKNTVNEKWVPISPK